VSRGAGKVQPDWLTGKASARKPNHASKPKQTSPPPTQATTEAINTDPASTVNPSPNTDASSEGRPVDGRGWWASVSGLFAPGDAGKAKRWDTGSAVLAVAALTLLVIGVVWWVAPFSVGSEEEAEDMPEDALAVASPIEATGIAFDALEIEDGRARLSTSDGLVWEGSSTAGEEGETITLTGPTAVQIKRGFELPGSSIQSGTYAVAEPDGRVIHVTFNTFMASGSEVSQGSIFAIEDDRLVHSGFYRDERRPGSDEVIRTYIPPGEANYRASFTAPEGTPIPLLAGFEGVSHEP
jgi:hypothetical protein